uniref:D-proline reductase, PrdB subunit n=1 Tax=uncultured organism TaxID=155900 RepID=M1P1M6_9ZZZZ|nr:D-proline reductase, PrdB subunit [uncultured organism]
MGLVARFLEEEGFSTVMLTMVPEYNREIGIPRVAAIEYPFGRPVGEVGDIEGQRAVLMETLNAFDAIDRPGGVCHLPFTWEKDPMETDWQPPEPSPIIKMMRKKKS